MTRWAAALLVGLWGGVFGVSVGALAQSQNTLLDVEGTLSPSDFQLDDGSFYDNYFFEGQAGQALVVQLSRVILDGTHPWLSDDVHVVAQTEINQLLDRGDAALEKANYTEAITFYEQALNLSRSVGDRWSEGASLRRLGLAYYELGEFEHVIEFAQQAIAIHRELGDRQSEGYSFTDLGRSHHGLGQFEQAIDAFERAIAIYREVGDREWEGISLGELAGSHRDLGDSFLYASQHEEAVASYQQVLRIYREIGDRQGEANSLYDLGNAYARSDNYEQAIDFFEQALRVNRAIGNRQAEGSTLSRLAYMHAALSDYSQAIDIYEQSVAISREIGDRQNEAFSLRGLGGAYADLGDYDRAIRLYEESLNIFRGLGSYLALSQEGEILNDLGKVYVRLGDYERALELLEQALSSSEGGYFSWGERIILGNLGDVYYLLGDYQRAIALHQQALDINSEVGNRQWGEATSLTTLGAAYAALGDYGQAIEFYSSSLSISREIGDREIEGYVLSRLGALFNNQAQPELAIIFLKTSVAVRESIREDIRGLDSALQQSYTNRFAADYRLLADLLLEQGRIPEAQQVLDLLKLEELREFTDTRAVWTGSELRYTTAEQSVIESHGSLITLGSTLVECERTNCANLDTLYDQQEALLAQYNTQVARFTEAVRTNRSGDELFQNPDNISGDAQALLEAYAEDGQTPVLIYPFVLEDKLWLVWVTVGDVIGSVEVPVSQRELARTVQRLGELLQNRTSSIGELQATSKQLYDWLIQPIAGELGANDVDHLIFVNDRVTRYIPMAVLHDGEQYLVERYTLSTVLAPSATDMSDKLTTARETPVLGLGLTQAVSGFNPLPAVGAELAAIIQTPNGNGIYPGLVLLNNAFTLDTFKNNISGHRILHIATHAAFVPGRAEESFIVMGDGSRMKISDIETMQRRLRDLHLVVLSACQTALGGSNQDGTEIAGLSSYFLETGRAEAVIASLWSVSDNSTSLLMQRFYENLASGDLPKVEALRQAQLAMLGSDQLAAGEERFIRQRQGSTTAAAPLSHPYYWAPFILIGNGL